MGASATDALEVVREEVGDPREWENGERAVATDLRYAGGEQVSVHIRKRGRRYDIDDGGAAVATARSFGVVDWRDVAATVVDAHDLNVNRRGVVFVPAVEGRDLAWLAYRVARCSYAVHSELLDTLG
jgi:hypothetical protein